MMNAPRSAIGDLLRSSTRLAHAAVDRHPILRPLVSPAITRGDYARALASLHALYAVLEPRLGDSVVVGSTTYCFRSRREALDMDLRLLGQTPFADFGHFGKVVPSSADEAVGVLYVLEGSRLGGAFILGNLRKAAIAVPMNFFADLNTDPHSVWASFQQMLTAEQGVIAGSTAATASSNVFSSLARHLDDCLDETLGKARTGFPSHLLPV